MESKAACKSYSATRFFRAGLLFLLMGTATGFAQQPKAKAMYDRQSVISSPAEAQRLLMEGNNRFITGTILQDNLGLSKRETLVKSGQHPFAVIVCCSDSRVPPELIFDQGLGDLFVIRAAGHVVDSVGLGSIEYAVEHLHTPLVMVLGHEQCGAVSAAVEGGKMPGSLPSIIGRIAPAVRIARMVHPDGEHLLDQVILENVKINAFEVSRSPVIEEALHAGKVRIVGAVYEMESGKVNVITKTK